MGGPVCSCYLFPLASEQDFGLAACSADSVWSGCTVHAVFEGLESWAAGLLPVSSRWSSASSSFFWVRGLSRVSPATSSFVSEDAVGSDGLNSSFSPLVSSRLRFGRQMMVL